MHVRPPSRHVAAMNLQACVIRYFPIPVYVLKVVVSAGVRRNLKVQKEPCSAPERKYAGLRTSALPYQRLWLGPSVSWEKGMGMARWGISKNRTKVRKYGSTRTCDPVRVHVQSTLSFYVQCDTKATHYERRYYFYVHACRTTMIHVRSIN